MRAGAMPARPRSLHRPIWIREGFRGRPPLSATGSNPLCRAHGAESGAEATNHLASLSLTRRGQSPFKLRMAC